MLNDVNNLELFNEAVKLIHRNRCKTALRRKAPAVELSHVYDQEVPQPKCEEIEVGGMSQSRSSQGETEEQTQVEDQVEERTFHHQQGDGSQGTGDDANQEARDPHRTRRQRNTETGRRERAKDREHTTAARLSMRKCIRMAEGACQDQLSFPAMQVTSSHVSIWFDFPVS